MFNPIISVNTVGIVFPTASIYFLLFPHNLNSESNLYLQTILNRVSRPVPQSTVVAQSSSQNFYREWLPVSTRSSRLATRRRHSHMTTASSSEKPVANTLP
jgi:hypothetical protein